MNKPTGSIPRDALDQALKVIEGWKELKDKLMVPNFTMTDFQNAISETQQKIEAAEKKRQERKNAVKVRNKVLEELWDLTKRVRNAAKATFGDDSVEMEKFGGRVVRFRKAYRKNQKEEDEDEE